MRVSHDNGRGAKVSGGVDEARKHHVSSVARVCKAFMATKAIEALLMNRVYDRPSGKDVL
jgi:hypothetical protein